MLILVFPKHLLTRISRITLHVSTKFDFHSRVKCVACRVISHEGCISTLNDRFPCKETFRECVRTYREQTVILHHWVTR